MSRPQKYSAAAVFAIVIVDIIMGLMRNVAVLFEWLEYTAESTYEISLIMQAFEPGLAVIVCALPAYRVLLPDSRKRRQRPEEQQPAIPSRWRESTVTIDTIIPTSELEMPTWDGDLLAGNSYRHAIDDSSAA